MQRLLRVSRIVGRIVMVLSLTLLVINGLFAYGQELAPIVSSKHVSPAHLLAIGGLVEVYHIVLDIIGVFRRD